ncbi:MAG: biosynthetic-type acetolactate synthase large subunit [Brevinematales bacterium]|nr:biosynthetic-type acetolactate synthase large subunit [Brevinematales bacterium]
MLTGAKILIESLKKEGVEVVFGYPGGVVIPIFDVLYEEKDIKLVHVRHEQGAAHAADGYARATGKVGVCLATSGPGATNLVTGIATAYMDSIPMVALTGQVATSMIGSDAFQEADITGITRSITKHNFLVKDVKDLARIIKEAFYIASTGRPGPVLVDLPKDVLVSKTEFNYPDKVELRGYKPKVKIHLGQIKKAIEMINEAKKPLIYYGGGVILGNASSELTEFVRKSGIPVTSTLMGLGGYPGDYKDPLYLGMLGMHGTVYANYAMHNCDLIIAIGARFDDRVTGKLDEFAPNAKIIHIDIDPSSISKNVVVDVPIVGDVKEILVEINKLIKPVKITEWLEQVANWKEKYPLTYTKDTKFVKPQYVVDKLSELTKGNAIIATEVGQHQMWVAQYYQFVKPRTLLTSGGLGTMGYGLPASIGAKVAFPDKTVITVAGDGSLQMNIQELATAIAHDINIKVIILNNAYLGMVRQWQELFYSKRYSGVCLAKTDKNGEMCGYYPDFIKIAEAYGFWGKRITTNEEVEKALKELLEVKGPALLDIWIEKEENVFPMVPAGANLTQMIGGLA